MSEFIPVARTDEIAPGSCRRVEAGGRAVAIINLDGSFHAIDDCCTHAEASLADGEIHGDEIMCPLHFATFNIRTGEAMSPPADEPVATYPIRVTDDGSIEVKVEPA